jgi:transposase
MRKSSSKKSRRQRARAKPKPATQRADKPAVVAKLEEMLRDHPEGGEVLEEVVELIAERAALVTERAALVTESSALRTHRDSLQHQVKYLTRLLYGRRSEKLSAEELGQLVLAFGGTEEEAKKPHPAVPHPEASAEEALPEGETPGRERAKHKRRKHPGRTRLSPELERRVTEVPVPPSERACQCCGTEMEPIGKPLEHERVEFVPAKLVVHVERRHKLGCKACRGDAVTAERVNEPAVRRRAGLSLLGHLLESKCDDALPIHRQRDQLRRLGFDVPVNTLYGYFRYATEVLRPIADTTLSVVLGDPVYVALDDTRLRVLDKSKQAGAYNGHLWCFTGSGPLVAYAFTETWEAQEVAPWIGAIEGFIQCDDYAGYGASVKWPDGGESILVPPERRLGCSMHVRRRFHKAFKTGDKRAAEPLELIRVLYEIEADAKERELDADARGELRAKCSLPVLDRFDAWVDEHKAKVVPSSLLARAIGYAEQQRPFIRRCFEDGRFEIDNGHTERQIREPAIGRKNYLFSGSADAARRLAGAYTLVQSCHNLGISTRDYLIDVLHKVERGWPLARIRELVPDRWAELHADAARQNDLEHLR